MDQSTHEIRLANWRSIIEKCLARPKGQSARQWLAENHIPEKQYYYWLRRIRKQAYEGSTAVVPAAHAPASTCTSFAEIPYEAVKDAESEPIITIRTRNATFEISSSVSEAFALKLVKEVAHAL